MLSGKKIILGISGSIAAYKAAILTRLLVKAGCQVRVVMTPASTGFIAPLTLATLSGNNVIWELADNDSWNNHVEYGLWADLFLIAPASANTLAKMAHGYCDTMLQAVYLSARCPVMIAPAMDEDMWKHPATQKNISTLQSMGHQIIPVEHGELASGLIGPGRMAEPEQILKNVEQFFGAKKKLNAVKALVCLGPTVEAIDAVRFISNHSSGKMGIALANALRQQGAAVTIVSGPVKENIPAMQRHIRVTSAAEMYEAVLQEQNNHQLIIMAAAVADYTVEHPADHKIKKSGDTLTLTLTKTKDILMELGKRKQPGQLLIGFALETNDEEQNALKKLEQKNADYIILNSLNDEGAGFAGDMNRVTVFSKKHKPVVFPLQSKSELSKKIIEHILVYEAI
ncbi:phosphopantothenoylcysteine decarboxylase [Bacteroidota bacterium]|nr:phosphopantothenoylcysteine decarboxylase [Bacteroidota bacterium]